MPVLYVAGVSISDNIKDTPEKTLNIISKCTVAVGEERSVALKLLSAAKSSAELYLINEHTADNERIEILKAVERAEYSVFFSDAGTPCISDPDYKFIGMCRDRGIIIKSLPGASSITSAVSVSGINAKTFFFAGFPPREAGKRRQFFENIEKSKVTTVFMERPYSLTGTLKDMLFFKRKVSISLNLGCHDEVTYYDYPDKLLERLEGVKAPFVIVAGGKMEKNHKK